MSNQITTFFYAITTILLAMVFESLELILGSWSWLAPSWVLIMLLFWVSDRHGWFGVIMAWIFGMLVDVWTGTSLGQHGLLFIFASFVVTFIYKDFRLVEPFAQAVVIAVVVFSYKILNDLFSFGAAILLDISTLTYLATGITSSIVWMILILFFPQKTSR